MNWWQRLFKREQAEKRLDAELRFHLETLVAAKVRDGLTEDEARRLVRLEFGGLDQVKEECRDARGTRWVETIAQDLRFAWRTLRKSPAFAVIAVLTLALGIGANTAVFTIVNGVLLRPLPFPEAEKLFLISCLPNDNPFITGFGLADRDYVEFRRHDRIFEHIATFNTHAMTLTGAGDPVRLAATSVTPDFFTIVRVSAPTASGPNRVVLLSDQLWRSRFNSDAQITGKTITLDGIAHTVAGVLPAGFNFPNNSEIWTPLTVELNPHNSFIRPVIGRIRPGFTPQQGQSELEAFVHNADYRAQVVSLKDSIVAESRTLILVFAGAVAFVLLIACANVANLLLIRATARRQEVTVRAALGAGRWRLVRQFLTESLLVSLLGGAGGAVLAIAGVPAILALAPAGKIPRIDDIHIDAWVLLFTATLSLLTGILFGLAPALNATRSQWRETMSGSGRTSSGRHAGFRSALVISEIALALVLLAGAGLLLKSFLRLRAVNPGFRPENLLTVTVDLPDSTYQTVAQIQAFHQRTLEKLAVLPGVISAGAVNWLPLGEALTRGDFQLEGGRRLPPNYIVDKPAVSPDYFRTIGIRLLRGRDFTGRDNAANPGVVIISQSVANQLWPGQDPIGKRISMEDHPQPQDWLNIVGIVDDVRQHGLTGKPDPAIYQPYRQVTRPFFLTHMTFALRTASDPQGLAPAMRSVLREVDKDQPIQSIATMQDLVDATTTEPRFQTRLLAGFAMLALLLAAIGIYGVLAYSVSERTHEIGIRMALGASRGSVMGLVLRNTFTLAAAGITLGIAGALAATRVLAKFLFDVKPTDPATFIAVALLLTSVAIFAGWIPARRATRVDPAAALRCE